MQITVELDTTNTNSVRNIFCLLVKKEENSDDEKVRGYTLHLTYSAN